MWPSQYETLLCHSTPVTNILCVREHISPEAVALMSSLCLRIFHAYVNYTGIAFLCTISPCVAVSVSFIDVVSPAWMVGKTLSGLGWIYSDSQRINQLCSKSRVLFVSASIAACWPTGGQKLKCLWKCLYIFWNAAQATPSAEALTFSCNPDRIRIYVLTGHNYSHSIYLKGKHPWQRNSWA